MDSGKRSSSPTAVRGSPPGRMMLIVPTAFAFSHPIVRGVTAYAQERGPAWEPIFRPGHSARYRPRPFVEHVQAAIMHGSEAETQEAVQSIHGPIVLVEQPPFGNLPVARADNQAVGRMAFEHLAGLEFKHFAYWGNPDIEFSQAREKGVLSGLLPIFRVLGSSMNAKYAFC